jgi:O-succinylbenzoic acid--CoA ligase
VSLESLPDWLQQRAYLTPDRIGLIAGGQQWTFQALDREVTLLATSLAALGLRSGSRVALLLRNSQHVVMLVHAISRIGAVLVPINIRLTPDEIHWQLEHIHANLLIYDEANAQAARSVCTNLLALLALKIDNLPSTPSDSTPVFQDRFPFDAVHSIIYTSGTTGYPKGAMLTYGNFWWSAIGSALNLGTHNEDRWLACLPLFHVGGLSILLRSVIYGITAIVHESFDPIAVNRAIDDDSVTIFSAVSVMLQRMIDARGDRPYPPTLRCILLGGGPASRNLLEACAQRKIPVVQTYGLTESASQVATLAPDETLRKLGSAGKPLFPTELRIENPDSGGVGEIIVRGPTITPGYSDRPDATETAIRDGWLHTGDLGYLDDEGYLYVVDRRDDLIISGGENIYPAEVESVLMGHPAVEEAGVIGIPDAQWGQVPAAAIKLRTGEVITEADLITYCYKHLAKYKIPARFQVVESLPRNAAGKLLRRAIHIPPI